MSDDYQVPVLGDNRVAPFVPVLGDLDPGQHEDDERCGWRFHLFDGSLSLLRCNLPRGHLGGTHNVDVDGGWLYLPAGCAPGDAGAMAGLAWARLQFEPVPNGPEKPPEPPQLPDPQPGPHEARAVLDIAEGGPYRGYAGDWVRQLVTLVFKSDRINRDAFMVVFPAYVAAVDLYERDPTQLRLIATFDREGGGE